MIQKIATVGIPVNDQPKALQFWTEKVGFEVKNKKEMGNDFYWLEVGPPGAESALVLYPKKMMPQFADSRPSIVFACANIEQLCTRLKQNGVVFTKDLASTAWGKFASFLDEDGNEFGLKE
jgi:lactoylglutathione lyase